MAKKMTIQRAARMAGMHTTTVRELCRSGKIPAHQAKDGRRVWTVDLPVNEVADHIRKLVPKGGYRRKRSPSRVQWTSGGSGLLQRLTGLAQWAEISSAKRELLLKLAKFTEEELEVLLSL